jgi:hypothetical protein
VSVLQGIQEQLLIQVSGLFKVRIAFCDLFQDRDSKTELGQSSLTGFAEGELDEFPGSIRIFSGLRDDEAGAVDTGGLGLGTFGHRSHAKLDPGLNVTGYSPVAHRDHGGNLGLEKITAIFA